jgi:hypothetical protein
MNRIKKNVMARRRDSGDRATQPSSPTARRFHLGGPLARAMTQKMDQLNPKRPYRAVWANSGSNACAMILRMSVGNAAVASA